MLLASEKTRISPRASRDGGVQRARLADARQVEHAQPLVARARATAPRCRPREPSEATTTSSAVGRVVERREVVDLVADDRLLVVGGDDDAHRRRDRRGRGAGAAAAAPASQHERREAGVGVADERRAQPEQQAAHAARLRPDAPSQLARRCARRRTPPATARGPRVPRRSRSAGSAARRRSASAIAGASPGGDEQAADAVADELRDPGEVAGHHRQAAAHRLHERRPGCPRACPPASARSARRGRRRPPARRRPAPRVGRAGQHDAVAEAGGGDLRARASPGPRPVADQAAARRRRRRRPAAGTPRPGGAWPLTSCSVPDADDPQRPRRAPAVAVRREQRRVDPGADDVDLVGEAPAALGDDQPAVVAGDRGHERGLGDLRSSIARSTCRSDPCAVKL